MDMAAKEELLSAKVNGKNSQLPDILVLLKVVLLWTMDIPLLSLDEL